MSDGKYGPGLSSMPPPVGKDNFKQRQEDAKKKQTGDLPPDMDEQTGLMINPHNPDYITKVPWYLGNSGPTLKHHNLQKSNHELSLTEADQLFAMKVQAQKEALQSSGTVTKFRKGACKNCGAMTHNEKGCVERPRSFKRAAYKTGLDIAPDEISLQLDQHGKVSYSAKRDSWQGYDAEEYQETIMKFERIEAERKKQRAVEKEKRKQEEALKQLQRKQEKEAARLAKQSAEEGVNGAGAAHGDDETGDDTASDSDSDSDSDGDGDDSDEEDRELILKDDDQRDFQSRMARQGGVGGAQMKTTQRNLRIREDTPKYLRNLDLNSAFYDPKARSMRSNPLPNENPEDLAFAGDNFVRYTGDALAMQATQVLCWEMQARGETLDLISNPSQAELVQKQFRVKKRELEESKRKAILEKYGAPSGSNDSSNIGSLNGSSGAIVASSALDPRLRLGQTESYIEYSADGRVLKGAPKVAPRTKYDEDVYEQNHTSVWGSFYSRTKRAWGYACCHQFVRGAYCIGELGIAAEEAAALQDKESLAAFQSRKKEAASGIASSSGGSVGQADAAKGKDALRKAAEWQKVAAESEAKPAGEKAEGPMTNKRGYNSMTSVDVTSEDVEEWRLKRLKDADPMTKLMESEELLEYKK